MVMENKILNEDGLRNRHEFVDHKILDCMGDLMLSGYRIFGHVKTSQGGHQLTTALLKEFFSNKTNKFIFSIFLIFAYFFSALSISEVFEDYISNEKTKYVANRLLYISAIIIPLLTIIILLNLK